MTQIDWYTERPLNAVDNMLAVIEQSSKIRNSNRARYHKDAMGSFRFMQEFGNVKIQMPRQSGHSTVASMLLYAVDDAIVYVPTTSSLSSLRGIVYNFQFLSIATKTEMVSRIFKATGRAHQFRESKFIIMDQASTFTTDAREVVLRSHANCDLLIELG